MGELKRYEIQSDYESWYAFERDDGDYVLHADAAAKIADLERAVEVLAEAFDTVERHCGYDNFAGTKGVDLVDAKGFLDRMTSGNYMHHSRAAVGYIGRVLAWINKTSTAMNSTRKKIRNNPTANAALEAAKNNPSND